MTMTSPQRQDHNYASSYNNHVSPNPSRHHSPARSGLNMTTSVSHSPRNSLLLGGSPHAMTQNQDSSLEEQSPYSQDKLSPVWQKQEPANLPSSRRRQSPSRRQESPRRITEPSPSRRQESPSKRQQSPDRRRLHLQDRRTPERSYPSSTNHSGRGV